MVKPSKIEKKMMRDKLIEVIKKYRQYLDVDLADKILEVVFSDDDEFIKQLKGYIKADKYEKLQTLFDLQNGALKEIEKTHIHKDSIEICPEVQCEKGRIKKKNWRINDEF